MSVRMNMNSPLRRRDGFTLLEIMLSVAILSMMALALYQFVSSTILVARVADSAGSRQAELAGFNRVVQAQVIRCRPGSRPAPAC